MEVLIKHLTRRRSGAVVSHDKTLSCEQVRFGRSTDNEVELLDARVLLHEGALHMRASGLFYEAAPQANAMIDGQVANSGPVRPGTTIQVGPYEVVVLDAAAVSERAEIAVSVEMVRPPDDSLTLLQGRSRTSLAEAGWGRRGTSWTLAIVVLALFLAWPVASYFMERADGPRASVPIQDMPAPAAFWPVEAELAWNSGEISGPHKFIANDCGACHLNAFEQVPDRACAACHATIPHHVDPVRFAGTEVLGETAGVACQSCHKEHRGAEPIVLNDQAFCADCHSALDAKAPNTRLLNVEDFGRDHPQFRPTVVIDAAAGTLARITLDPAAWPVENSNLRFTHAAHMKPGGLRMPGRDGFTELQCADCHATEPGGAGLLPIDMEQHCAQCHLLHFEPTKPDRTLPHGDLQTALLTVQEFYSDLALRGEVTTPDAPAVVRRRPGTQLTEQERLGALAWAEDQAEMAAAYTSRSVCGICHEMSETVTADAISWDIKPVLVTDRWLPKGLFHHGSHDNMQCSACHKAETSTQATDVLLPQIGLCQQCHGGEEATDRVPSGCIRCHGFHFEGLPAMAPTADERASLGTGGMQ